MHDRRIDRNYGYPVPYRCFYSRNIDNLFMAGRCISVTHEALGTIRVMKTCGMMGEVVGRAASICIERDCLPRDVYQRYWPDLEELLQLPGKARRDSVASPIQIPADALPLASPTGPLTGLDPETLEGLVIDDEQAEKQGAWTKGSGLKGYVGRGYLYASGKDCRIRFSFQASAAGEYEIRLAYLPHENRGTSVHVVAESSEETIRAKVNMQLDPPLEHHFISIGALKLKAGEQGAVMITTQDAGGIVHADAIQLIRKK